MLKITHQIRGIYIEELERVVSKIRICIFYTRSFINDILVRKILETFSEEVSALVVLPVTSKSSKLISSTRKTSFHYAIYRGFIYFGYLIYYYKALHIGSCRKTIISLAKEKKVPIKYFSSPNCVDLNIFIKSLSVDLIINATTQIYKSQILRLPKFGCFNYHAAPLPKYRGLNPFIAQINNGEPCITLSIHKIEEGIDTGDIYIQDKMDYKYSSNLLDIELEAALKASEMFLKLIKQFEENRINSKRQHKEGATYFSLPNRKDIKQFYEKGYRLFYWKHMITLLLT